MDFLTKFVSLAQNNYRFFESLGNRADHGCPSIVLQIAITCHSDSPNNNLSDIGHMVSQAIKQGVSAFNPCS